jgi:hypothetical protein
MKPPVELLPVAPDRCHASTNGRSRSRRDFATVVVPMHTTSRTPISRWPISRCLSGLLSSCSQGLILRATSADPTAVGDPAPNLTALAAFDYSLLSIIHLSELVFCLPVIFNVAINDKHSLSVH